MLPRGMLPLGLGGVGSGSPPNLAMDHTVYERCLPSESDAASFGYSMVSSMVMAEMSVHALSEGGNAHTISSIRTLSQCKPLHGNTAFGSR